MTGNTGGEVPPDADGNLNLLGSGNISVDGNAGTNTETITLVGTTNHAVQVGNASGSLTSIGTGSSGQILQSAGASSDPAYTTSTYPSTNAQGDLIYGSAANTLTTLTKNTNATRYLANTGTSNNPNWDQVNLSTGVTGTLTVPNGGTGDTSFTTYSVICGGTSNTGPLQSVVSVGTSGQVLTSNGAGALPTFQNSSGGDVVGPGSATDNALVRFDGATGKLIKNGVTSEDNTGNITQSASVSGATLSLTTANTSNTASSNSQHLISVGGTSAADAFTTYSVTGTTNWSQGVDNSDSDAYVLAASNALGSTNVMRASTAGEITYPLQPAFLASLSAAQSNVTGDNTAYTIVFDTERFDQNSDYNDSTGIFTAPVTGRYLFACNVNGSAGSNLNSGSCSINTSNVTVRTFRVAATTTPEAATTLGGSILVDMDASDTCNIVVNTNDSGGKDFSIAGPTGAAPNTSFSGYLVC